MFFRAIIAMSLAGLIPGAAVPAGEVRVAAAASLRPLVEEMAAVFAETHPDCRVTAVYGASGKLTAQIHHGARFDVFLAADTVYPKALVDAGAARGPVQVFALGRLAVIAAAGAPRTLEDLADPTNPRIALANPRLAPYGARAVEALTAAGVWSNVAPRAVYGESVAQAVHFVRSGAAGAGVVALSLALHAVEDGRLSFTPVDPSQHGPIEHGWVVVGDPDESACLARFAEMLNDPAMAPVLERHGFSPPARPGGL
jgi:molybdate transport system substrate-binding protein